MVVVVVAENGGIGHLINGGIKTGVEHLASVNQDKGPKRSKIYVEEKLNGEHDDV